MHACLEGDPADRPGSTDLYHKVEKCMKEIDSLLAAQGFENQSWIVIESSPVIYHLINFLAHCGKPAIAMIT